MPILVEHLGSILLLIVGFYDIGVQLYSVFSLITTSTSQLSTVCFRSATHVLPTYVQRTSTAVLRTRDRHWPPIGDEQSNTRRRTRAHYRTIIAMTFSLSFRCTALCPAYAYNGWDSYNDTCNSMSQTISETFTTLASPDRHALDRHVTSPKHRLARRHHAWPH